MSTDYNDYEEWKRKRNAEQNRRDDEKKVRAGRASQSDNEPAPPPLRSPREVAVTRRRGCQGRGCLGCLGLLIGLISLLVLGLSIFETFYWRSLEQQGKTNLLVLGVDERKTEPPPFRSDTMILTAFNPNKREVAMLSIPRDLWLDIPGYGKNRINTAHFFGGAELAKEAVKVNLGVPLSYYVKINFDGFTGIIDAMGGITVDVKEALHDENYPTPDYGITTIDIPAGVQTMDGATALIYARSRYSTTDFDRSRRQQEIISAIRDRLQQPTAWWRIPLIYTAFTEAITTDIPTSEWPAFALILVRSEIKRFAITHEYTQDVITNEGAQVLLPIWGRINPILAEHFE